MSKLKFQAYKAVICFPYNVDAHVCEQIYNSKIPKQVKMDILHDYYKDEPMEDVNLDVPFSAQHIFKTFMHRVPKLKYLRTLNV